MAWLHEVAVFFGGAVFANAIPHTVAGMMGRPFQSPFARPPGQGLSSSTTNVLWGFFNLAIAYGLLVRLGAFDGRALADVGAAFAGALLIGLFSAIQFGRFNGGTAAGR